MVEGEGSSQSLIDFGVSTPNEEIREKESGIPTPPPVKQPRPKKSPPPLRPPSNRQQTPTDLYNSEVWGESHYFPKKPRNSRTHQPSSNLAIITEPITIKEALEGPQSQQWYEAAVGELDSHVVNNTWTLVPPPTGEHILPVKWVFIIKKNPDGSISRFKARLVVRGDRQRAGIDYDELFAPTTHFSSVRTVLCAALAEQMEVHVLDVKTAFLNGTINTEIYVRQPPGFTDQQHPDWVCKLNKSLYGLKQAPRIWNETINNYLKEKEFTRSLSEPCLYIRVHHSKREIICLHVDDLLLSSSQMALTKKLLMDQFEMTDHGPISVYLNVEYHLNLAEQTLICTQRGYIKEILHSFNMSNCKPISTPMEHDLQLIRLQSTSPEAQHLPYREAIGKLIYLASATRPDIAYAVSYLSRFASGWDHSHWTAIQRVLRYLQATANHSLVYSNVSMHGLEGYIDADWGRDSNDRKSTTGYIFRLGDATISWQSKKQSTIAISSTEAEYLSATQGTKEALHLRALLTELGYKPTGPTTLHEDNQSCISLALNPIHHARTKHLDIQLHFVRDRVNKQAIQLQYIPTEENCADILTKPLSRVKFEKLRTLIGVLPISK